jgi:DNA-binding MarR family transcriptional regulator
MKSPAPHPRDAGSGCTATADTALGALQVVTDVRADLSDRPFVDDYLPALLGQAAQRIQGEFHRVVREHGFAVSEWRVLATLADGRAVSTGRLAEVSLTKGPTATRLLDRMVARGEVERLADPQDRRVTRVRITGQGQRTVSALIHLARQHERQVLSRFGLDQAETLKAMLREMTGPVDAEPERSPADGSSGEEGFPTADERSP